MHIRFWLILLAISSLIILPAQGANLIYVSLANDSVVSYDVSLTNASAVAASATTFVNSNLNGVYGITFNAQGNLYAANAGDNSVSVFSPTGVYQSKITGNLSSPFGLSIDPSGNLYASNFGDNTVSKYNSSGLFQSKLTNYLNAPVGLANDLSGDLYVANSGDSTISRFDYATGAFVSVYGAAPDINTPYGLARDNKSGNLYVANSNGNSITKYNMYGVYQSKITTNLSIPIGVAVDSDGNIYAANASGNTIAKFDSSGSYKFSWSTGLGAGGSPHFLAFSPVTVPEPSTVVLSIIGAGTMLWLAYRRESIN